MSKNSYSKVGGENVRLLQALIDEAPSYTKPTNSRNANILKSIINNTEYNEPPQSEIEELLIALKAKIGGEIEVNELTVTENGSYDAGLNKAYNPVNVELPLDSKQITANGIYNASDDNLAGFSQVTVNVEGYKLKDIENTPTAIATFTDGADLPMPKLEVGIEPQQDLHGYDAPWVGGAGKNKFDVDNISEIQTTAEGRRNGQVYEGVGTFTVSASANTLSGNYIYSRTYKNGVYSSADTIATDSVHSSKTYTLAEGDKLIVFDASMHTIAESKQVFAPAKVQIEQGSTATAFAPYSNICPISGWSEVDVTRCGKNLLNESAISNNKLIDGNGNLNDSSVTKCTEFYIKIKGLDTITVSYDYESLAYSNDRYYAFYDANKNFLSSDKYTPINKVIQISIPNNAVYIRMAFDKNTTNIMIELGSTATAYEPYNGHTYTIDLDGTRYGGKVDLVSGVMTVDRAYVDLGTLNWSKYGDNKFYTTISDLKAPITTDERNKGMMCDRYKPSLGLSIGEMNDNSYLRFNQTENFWICDSNYADAEAFKTAMDGVQLVYELATPLTIQLTPTLVKTLQGINNVFADSGDVLSGKYFAEL